MTHEDPGASALRRSVLLIAAVGILGLLAELLVERHWGTLVRYVPWLCLVALAWSVWRLWRGPSPRDIRNARTLAGGSAIAGVVGIALHINENYTAGPLDQNYSLVWDSMNEAARWWAAFTKSLGPAPTFAPAALILLALLVIVATQRHPALAR